MSQSFVPADEHIPPAFLSVSHVVHESKSSSSLGGEAASLVVGFAKMPHREGSVSKDGSLRAP